MDKCKTQVQKKYFLKNAGLFLRAMETVLNKFKIKTFRTKNSDEIQSPKSTINPTVFAMLPKLT